MNCRPIISTNFLSGLIVILLVMTGSNWVNGEISGPGWIMSGPATITPEQNDSYYQLLAPVFASPLNAPTELGPGNSATESTTEIKELARALKYDPKLIYEFVRNHIDYVPYFGSLKGATLTLLDWSGNDFDQASLLIALLREGNIPAQYIYGEMTIPTHSATDNLDMQHWLSIEDNLTDLEKENVLKRIILQGGLPNPIVSSQTTMKRVWVKATFKDTDGVTKDFLLDPAFKSYERIKKPGYDLSSAMGYNPSELIDSVGGASGIDSISNIDENILRTKLQEYTANLISFFQGKRDLNSPPPQGATDPPVNIANSSLEELIGGSKIMPQYFDSLPTSLLFPTRMLEPWLTPWDEIPDIFNHKVQINYGSINVIMPIPWIASKKLSLTHYGGINDTVPRFQEIPLEESQNDASPSGDSDVVYLFSSADEIYEERQEAPPIVAQEVDCGRVASDGTYNNCGVWTNPLTQVTGTLYVDPFFTNEPTKEIPPQKLSSLNGFSVKAHKNGALAQKNSSGYYEFRPSSGEKFELHTYFSGAGLPPGNKSAALNVKFWPSGPSYPYWNNYKFTGIVAEPPNLSGSNGIKFLTYLNEPREAVTILKNSGSKPLNINGNDSNSDIFITNDTYNQFRIVSGSGAGQIPAGGSREIKVRYLATAIGKHNAKITIKYSYDGISNLTTLALEGETVLLPAAQLWLEDGDTPIAAEVLPVTDAGQTLSLSIFHPYSANNGTYGDQIDIKHILKRGFTYVIISDFGGSQKGMLIQKRQGFLNEYRNRGLEETSREVITETLNIMGQTWMQETTLSDNLFGEMGDVIQIRHHRFGIIGQEKGYYVDVKAQVFSTISRRNSSGDEKAVFNAGAFLHSALEHGVLEQTMGSNNPAVSTVKLFQVANAAGSKFYYADKSNFPAIRSELEKQPMDRRYSQKTLENLKALLDQNDFNSVILPDNATLGLESQIWKGSGFIIKRYDSNGGMLLDMIIGGDYYGGFLATEGNVSPIIVSDTTNTKIVNNRETYTYRSRARDPVDMASGAYLFDHTDLQLGTGAPLGLSFTRSYDSNLSHAKRTLGYGWTHNYDIYLTFPSHGEPSLGLRQPAESAALIVALLVSLDLAASPDILVASVVTSLVSKWAVDQLIDNAVTVHSGPNIMEFIKLPDGTYSTPPGITTQLIKNPYGTFSLEERFGTKVKFDNKHRIASIADVDGNVMTFSFSGDKLTTVRDAFGRTLTFEYYTDSDKLLHIVRDSAGRSVSYAYENGDLTSYTDPENFTWQYGYDSNHRIKTLKTPLQVTTVTNDYDSLGRVKTQTVPRQVTATQSNPTVTYNFFFSGFRNMEKDPDGSTINYFYDEKGREYAIENALGFKSKKAFDGQNQIIEVTDPRGNSTGYTYDSNHNLTETTDAFNFTTINEYDDVFFRLINIYEPAGFNTHFEYDSKHHPTLARDPLLNQTTATYNGPKGFKDTSTDARGTKTYYTYDSLSYDSPRTKKTVSHAAITYDYYPTGQLKSLTDQMGATTSFQYYDRGLLKSITDPLGKITSFEYDQNGRLKNKYHRNNPKTAPATIPSINYTYTPTGKVDTITYMNGSTVSFKYDELDNLESMTDSLGTTYYTHDRANRLDSSTDPHGFKVSYKYDEAGNLTELTYPGPGNKKVIYTYDELNRLRTVKIDWLNKASTYSYKDNENRPTLLDNYENFNGLVTSYSYDAAQRLTGMTSPVATYGFPEIDDNGNRIQEVRSEPLEAMLEAGETTYTYNDPTKNRLVSAGSQSFGYDAEGQLATGYGYSYTFDHAKRLVGIGSSYQYYYDGQGSRLKASRNGLTTYYIYDAAGNLLAEADNSKTITRYYIYGAGLLAMVTVPANQVYTYHFNPIGSTIALTDQNGEMVNKYAYDPFGNIRAQAESIPQPFKFIGQFGVMSEPTGFYYMRARYYDPSVGRFISEDPLGFAGSDVNLYVYVGNSPIMFIDSDGEAINLAAAAAGAGIGAGVGTVIALYKGGGWSEVLRSAVTGALVGGTAGFSFGTSLLANAGAGTFIGGGTDFLNQVVTNKLSGRDAFSNIDSTSIFISSASGFISGGAITGAMSGGAVNAAITGSVIGGAVASGLTYAAYNGLTVSCCKP